MASLSPEHCPPAVTPGCLNYDWLASCLPAAGTRLHLPKLSPTQTCTQANGQRCEQAPSSVTTHNSTCLPQSPLEAEPGEATFSSTHLEQSFLGSCHPPKLRARQLHPRDLPGLTAGRFVTSGASDGSPQGRHKLPQALGLHLNQHLWGKQAACLAAPKMLSTAPSCKHFTPQRASTALCTVISVPPLPHTASLSRWQAHSEPCVADEPVKQQQRCLARLTFTGSPALPVNISSFKPADRIPLDPANGFPHAESSPDRGEIYRRINAILWRLC